MLVAILFHFLCAQHVSDINISIIRSFSACNTDTTPTQPHRNSNTHRTKNNTTNVVIQQNSRKLLMMDILMSETCWAHKKWHKIASDIKLVFYSSSIVSVRHNTLLIFETLHVSIINQSSSGVSIQMFSKKSKKSKRLLWALTNDVKTVLWSIWNSKCFVG